jgi:hypothetical protein
MKYIHALLVHHFAQEKMLSVAEMIMDKGSSSGMFGGGGSSMFGGGGSSMFGGSGSGGRISQTHAHR